MFTSTQGFAGDALDEVQAKGAHTLKTNGASIRREVPVPLRLADGFEVDSVVFSFSDLSDGLQHLAVGLGDFRNNPVPLVRPHSECLTGDVFGSADVIVGHNSLRRYIGSQPLEVIFCTYDKRGGESDCTTNWMPTPFRTPDSIPTMPTWNSTFLQMEETTGLLLRCWRF